MKRIAILPAVLLTWCSNVGVQQPTAKAAERDTSYLYSASFSPDGKRIAAGSDKGTITLWNVASGKRLRSIQVRGEQEDSSRRINTLQFSPNGRQLASGSGTQLRLWDVATGKLLRTFKGQEATIQALSFSPNGKQIVSGALSSSASLAGALKVWDVATGKLVRTLGSKQQTLSVAFSPDGRLIVSGGDDSNTTSGIRMWSATTGRLLRTFAGKQVITSVNFRSDGQQIVSSGRDVYTGSPQDLSYGFKIWDVATGKLIRSFPTTVNTSDAALSPDGKRIVSCGWDPLIRGNGVKLWNATTGKQLRALTGDEDFPRFVSFSPNGRQILSGGGDNTIKLWDAATGKRLRTFD